MALENAPDGSTITVTESYTDNESGMLYDENEPLRNVTLDLNGKEIQSEDGFYTGSNLLITGNGIYGGQIIQSDGTLTIENGSYGMLLVQTGTTELNGGTFRGITVPDDELMNGKGIMVSVEGTIDDAKAIMENILGERKTFQPYTITAKEVAEGYAVAYIGGPVTIVDEVHTVTFNPNGGTVSPDTAETENGKLPDLPIPERSGYRFNGWYTAESGGERVTTDTIFSETTTIYAQWTRINSSGGVNTYSIAVDKTENGKVSANRTSASAGSTVTVTVTPEKNYKLASLTVVNSKGDEIALTKNSNGTYSFKMPSRNVTVKAEFVKVDSVADCTNDETCPAYHFNDLDLSKWYHDGIHFCVENGLMQGISDTEFTPHTEASRGMIVTVLYRLEKEPSVVENHLFDDVKTGLWYEDAVSWAAANDIIEGYGDGKFGPDDTITREQMAAILYRYGEYKGYDVTNKANLSKFEDNSEISAWAQTALSWASADGLIEGDGDKLMPKENAQRCQIATILYRFCETFMK